MSFATALLACMSFTLVSTDAPTTAPTDRAALTPDYTQTDPAGNLPGGGRSFCGPSASSNALMFLADNAGYSKLKPSEGDDAKATQIALIKKLADAKYMGTVDGEGTGIPDLMKGLKQYVEDCGYSVTRLEQAGWRSKSKAFPPVADVPSLDWIRAGLETPNSVVLLNIGWYKYDADKTHFVRFGGHWITVVGVGKTSDGSVDPNVFLLHDPSPSSGPNFRTQAARLAPVTLPLVWKTTSAVREHAGDGLFQLTGDVNLHPTADAGIVDGAVVLILKPPME